MMRIRVCLALLAAPRRARTAEKKRGVHLLGTHQPFEPGDTRFGERERGAFLIVRRWRLQLGGGQACVRACGSTRLTGLPRLDPVVENL